MQAIALHPGEALEAAMAKIAKMDGTVRWIFFHYQGGVGIVLTKEAYEAMAMSLKLDFPVPCSNNRVEYEANIRVTKFDTTCKYDMKLVGYELKFNKFVLYLD